MFTYNTKFIAIFFALLCVILKNLILINSLFSTILFYHIIFSFICYCIMLRIFILSTVMSYFLLLLCIKITNHLHTIYNCFLIFIILTIIYIYRHCFHASIPLLPYHFCFPFCYSYFYTYSYSCSYTYTTAFPFLLPILTLLHLLSH